MTGRNATARAAVGQVMPDTTSVRMRLVKSESSAGPYAKLYLHIGNASTPLTQIRVDMTIGQLGRLVMGLDTITDGALGVPALGLGPGKDDQ